MSEYYTFICTKYIDHTNSCKPCISSGATNCKLLRWSTGDVLQLECWQRHHSILRCISAEQAHHVVHHRCITRQCDPAAVTCEPKLPPLTSSAAHWRLLCRGMPMGPQTSSRSQCTRCSDPCLQLMKWCSICRRLWLLSWAFATSLLIERSS
jgi:hypothetical protein